MIQIPRGFLFHKVGVNVFQIRNVMRYSVSKPSLEIHFLLPRGIQGFGCVPQLSKFSQKMGDIESKKAELRQRLTPLQYQITQEKGTERPFSGKYDKTTDAGIYSCIVCGQKLFSSETKYDSGCGWPAFNDVLDNGLVKLSKDTTHGMIRTEVQCSKCDAHLGHIFNDGPLPTRKRFCINSASLDFHPADLN